MSLRYLLGPVPATQARRWQADRDAGRCLAFNARGDADLTVRPSDSSDDVVGKLPSGWRPDFVTLYLPYTSVPAGLWSAPVPLVGLAPDWNLLWHHYRRALRRCDLVLTDVPGVGALAREGFRHARPANLFGCDSDLLDGPWPDGPRDIDVLFVGNVHRAVQRERLAWLGRLARLSERYRVVIASGVFGDEYRALLARARVVFNRGMRGECNLRVMEAAAAGALLFQEADNRETHDYFRHLRECVCYRDHDLEARLEHYLTHEDERRALAGAARERVKGYRFEALWGRALDLVAGEWHELTRRAAPRANPGEEETLLGRTWQALSAAEGTDAGLVADLARTVTARPQSAALHNALGVAQALAGQPATAVVDHFRRAAEADPRHVVAALNLAEARAAVGDRQLAAEGARQVLRALDLGHGPAPDVLDAPPYPPGFHLLRVEWERAAWDNAGRPAAEARAKAALLRWRLHGLLARLTGDLVHYHEAALARPDLPAARAALGRVLTRGGRAHEAVSHLRHAVEQDPLDLEAARELHQALTRAGDVEGAHALAHDRRLLVRAAPGLVRPEPWFAEAAPATGELVSLVILCHNQLDYTRLCLESVLRHTRPPYELVVVDNGSTDGTPAYLQGLAARPGPARVEVIRNEGNVGFPAGCNQGIAASRGRSVVFLNNDTVVTAGWLDGLIDCAGRGGPDVGLVGPVTSYAAAPQQVDPDYGADLAGLEGFADRRRAGYAGRALPHPRLTGFCLLVRREVLDAIGGFDERYGSGFFDDDDLCVRARRAGYRLLVALDVYIHHFGSRTFHGLGIDCRRRLRENFERFREKWGEAEVARYRLGDEAPAPSPAPPAARRDRPSVSLCMIVKDEEHNLPDCLGSVADLVDEVVIVDTGSADRTREIAARFGARVFDFAWVDSFAAARNESLRHATGDYVFWLDADDRLDEENRGKLRVLFAGLKDENAAYVMKCLCVPDPGRNNGTLVDHLRLFRNRPDVRWEFRVHEQILPAVRAAGGQVRWADVVVRHVGYADPSLRQRKLGRDLRLLRLEEAERPDHPFVLFNLGSVSQDLGQLEEALDYFRRSLGRSRSADSITRKLFALIASCHWRLGRREEALAACREGRALFADDAELLYREGDMREAMGDWGAAEVCWRRLVEGPAEAPHFASVGAGLRGHLARHRLALACLRRGAEAEAEGHWRVALAERPDFAEARQGLRELEGRRGGPAAGSDGRGAGSLDLGFSLTPDGPAVTFDTGAARPGRDPSVRPRRSLALS